MFSFVFLRPFAKIVSLVGESMQHTKRWKITTDSCDTELPALRQHNPKSHYHHGPMCDPSHKSVAYTTNVASITDPAPLRRYTCPQ